MDPAPPPPAAPPDPAAAELAALPEGYRAGVAAQLAALRAQAALVEQFPLPDELEPAPVFVP
ncbi:MAG TPA: AtzG-like protein [Steroidobacteraceae bacterium]|nr:AtzG-like protein [Steroidobacteraceae bacterium]